MPKLLSKIMRHLGYALIVMPWHPVFAVQGQERIELDKLRRSIFKIEVTAQSMDFRNPWKFSAVKTSSGTGFYIGKNRILTNAHVVANARYITVQRDGDSKPQQVQVHFIAHDCDLAILGVQDPQYFKGIKPLKFGDIPKLRSPVYAIGFPTGGEQISVTEGVVSRVDFRSYVHTEYHNHLLIQVDSAINAGNSGGPVMQNDEVIGVAFQSYASAENTGYVIPNIVMHRFLKDIEDGNYDGHPELGINIQKWVVINPAASAFHNLDQTEQGVKVAHVASWGSASKNLEAGDILLQVDSHPIGVDGKINLYGERVAFQVVPDLKQVGEKIGFQISRNGDTKDVSFIVQATTRHPFSGKTYVKAQKFIVWGGLVFTPHSLSLIQSWGQNWYMETPLILKYLLYHSRFDPELSDYEDFVVFADRLPHSVNAYMGNLEGNVVSAVNGVLIKSFKTFVDVLKSSKDPYVRIDFMGSQSPDFLPREDVVKFHKEIIDAYGVEPSEWLGDEVDGTMESL